MVLHWREPCHTNVALRKVIKQPSLRFEYCSVEDCTAEEIEQMGACDDVDCGSGGDCFMTPYVRKLPL